MVAEQEDDVMQAAAGLGEPYIPNGSQGGPLPHKQEVPDPRYTPFPSASGSANKPPPANTQGVSIRKLGPLLYKGVFDMHFSVSYNHDCIPSLITLAPLLRTHRHQIILTCLM